MAKTYIKDFYNRIIGNLEDMGDEIIARDFYNEVLGYYRKKENVTQNFYRKVIGKGDLTSGLIWKAWTDRLQKQEEEKRKQANGKK